MKSLVARLTLWFSVSFVVVTGMMLLAMHHHLEEELRNKNWRNNYPNHPDWTLHGSYSEAEINDVLAELIEGSLVYGIPLAAGACLVGHWVARKSVQPIDRVNLQISAIGAQSLSQRIEIPEVDKEFRYLVRNINGLIERLEVSFKEMNEYAAKVAHELRTPLAILRLKIEQADSGIPAELREDIQDELHQLTHVIDQSLLIARAEQGRVAVHPVAFDFAELVSNLAEDFTRLAEEDGREVCFNAPGPCRVVTDPAHIQQIVYNLLSNAYKHGTGTIRCTLKPVDRHWTLVLENQRRPRRPIAADTLGIGLRVVDTLLRLLPGVTCVRSTMDEAYRVELSLPAENQAPHTFP